MSELQNKIVALIQLQRGSRALVNMEERREDFIRHAIAIYHGMGGSLKDLQTIAETHADTAPRMDQAIGDILYELAAVGHVWDIDIIQAAYNRIDDEMAKVADSRRRGGNKRSTKG